MVACAYSGRVPPEALELLPEGFSARQFVARFENGKLTELVRGMPEQVLKEMLGAQAQPQADCQDCKDCKDCTDCKDCKPARPPAKP
ncbi:MAG: hypothetical protein KF696_09740 [Planctomycetes bacterium]|nr:hypothetical protein [Planctomycetota bacterium]MCW8136138.1 hypothetical protein [Planctomycetota bacterium]